MPFSIGLTVICRVNSRAKQTHLSVYFEQDAARPISLKHTLTCASFHA